MTHDDLSTLLNHHVRRDEPSAPVPGPAMQMGRRRLRARRLTSLGGVVTALVAAGVMSSVLSDRDGGKAGVDGMDPASSQALRDYDVRRMPTLMDQHVRRILTRTVPDLGQPRFAAYDAGLRSLPERFWDKASSLEVDYDTGQHRYRVSISHSRSEAEGNPLSYCRSGLQGGYYLDCTVSRSGDGDVVISKLEATQPDGPFQMVVNQGDLGTVDLDRLWFSRSVKVIKSDTLITSVSERVKATSRDPAAATFTTPGVDLATIGEDPVMVMPVPPPGDNGCPAWSWQRHGERVSCS